MQSTAAVRSNKSPSPLLYSTPIYQALCIPPVPEDLSLSKLDVENGRPRNQDLAGKIAAQLRRYCDADKFYAPNTSEPSALVSHPRKFTGEIRLTQYLRIHNNVHMPTEGTWLTCCEGIIYVQRGCPILVFEGGNYLCVAHAGRDSLIDRVRISTGTKSRRHESVIDAVMLRFKRLGVDPEKVWIHGFFGLDPQVFTHSFEDEVYGSLNRKMAYELNTSGSEVIVKYPDGTHKFVLAQLIRAQALRHGVPLRQIKYDHRLPLGGHFISASDSPISNLVVITRKAA